MKSILISISVPFVNAHKEGKEGRGGLEAFEHNSSQKHNKREKGSLVEKREKFVLKNGAS